MAGREVLSRKYRTFTTYTAISFVALTALYLGVYCTVYEHFSLTQISLTAWWSMALCVVLADPACYFEHRFLHRVGVGWATHTVQHSSRPTSTFPWPAASAHWTGSSPFVPTGSAAFTGRRHSRRAWAPNSLPWLRRYHKGPRSAYPYFPLCVRCRQESRGVLHAHRGLPLLIQGLLP